MDIQHPRVHPHAVHQRCARFRGHPEVNVDDRSHRHDDRQLCGGGTALRVGRPVEAATVKRSMSLVWRSMNPCPRIAFTSASAKWSSATVSSA